MNTNEGWDYISNIPIMYPCDVNFLAANMAERLRLHLRSIQKTKVRIKESSGKLAAPAVRHFDRVFWSWGETNPWLVCGNFCMFFLSEEPIKIQNELAISRNGVERNWEKSWARFFKCLVKSNLLKACFSRKNMTGTGFSPHGLEMASGFFVL